ncbi:GNAT family N-acetyltransferase [Streptomyces sp. RKAG337]|uniref:GNAT family N-acetyltransferase n=1 Tax=Streptomyces sp. RKAG337 TaxID=2893404 RepID=UPI0020341A99|nr:GNAT family N-acetyltransferase [Streptomyces sp. RKAG337]MCM2430982.1 GNAT family N-acetyltransferase [Streptomyces sp. RKAG337]
MPHPSDPIRPAPDRPPFTVREARRADTPAFMAVIDLANPHHPDPFGMARAVLASPAELPLSHHRDLCLLAEDENGNVVGALLGGPPRWLFEHAGIDTRALADRLLARLGMIHAVAVHPEHRRAGIGRTLIRHAEERFTRAGYGLVTLNHDPNHDEFYRGLGYTVDDQLLVHLPDRRLIGVTTDDTRMSSKPLRTPVRLADVPGAPSRIITGLLPGATLPPRAKFDRTRQRLRY